MFDTARFEAGMEALLDAFTFETNELLESLDEILMRTERDDLQLDDIAEIFRIMHTIKGSAAMMGLQNMSVLAHSIEDLFFIIRENPDTTYDKRAMYELLFEGSDSLKNEMANILDENAPLTDFSELTDKFHAFAAVMKGEKPKSDTTKSTVTIFPDDESDDISTVKMVYDESCKMPTIRAMVAFRNIGDYAEVCSTIPPDLDDDSADEEIMKNGLYVKLITYDMQRVLDILRNEINVESAVEFKHEDVKAVATPEPVSQPAQVVQVISTQQSEPAKNTQKKSAQSSIISVKLEKLDRLLDLVAEIVITESAVTSNSDLKPYLNKLDNFSKSARELKKLTDDLQDVVMSIRMVPIASAFTKMRRVVRDMNKKLDKNVELVFEGEDTEVDKSVVDILGDPLLHIVRNAIDHGIETAQERAKQGKTEKPTVVLSAGYDSSDVIIKCTDNGAGMDAKILLSKAKKKGILTKPENEYTDSDCFNMIMAAGFSTNEAITEYSGRGVGMDVVRKNIEKVGGKVTVSSELGKGSTFTIRIPLSLSIIDVFGVAVGGSNFSIDISSVREIFVPKPDQLLIDPDGTELVMLNGKCLPVIRLSEVFQLASGKPPLTQGIMLYCQGDGRSAVIFGDELTNDQQIVVKPFSPLLSRFNLKEKGLSGCSILADGSITLIADVVEIFREVGICADTAD